MKTTGPNAYLETKVNTADPAELRLMLLDGAIRFAEQCRSAISAQDHEGAYNGATRCQSILLELINALRPEHDPDLCKRLSALYTYMFQLMVKATSQRDPAIVDEVLKLLRFERETWDMLLEQLAQENRAAKAMTATPDAQPPLGLGGATDASSLIGGNVSVHG